MGSSALRTTHRLSSDSLHAAFLWTLSRQPQSLYQRIVGIAVHNGYDAQRIRGPAIFDQGARPIRSHGLALG
jgi:hypothetical protein